MKKPKYYRMFGYNPDLLPNAYLASLEEGVTNIDEAKEKTGFTIGYPGWGLIYHALLAHLDRSRHEVLIETGTNFGCTTIILAQALRDSETDGKVITFEVDPQNCARARHNFRMADVEDLIELQEGDTRVTLSRTLQDMPPIRFAFLDASHAHSDVMHEFETLLPHLTSDALVMFDNTYAIAEEGEDPRVNGALKDIMRRHGGNLINLEYVSWFTPGLAIWQKKPAL